MEYLTRIISNGSDFSILYYSIFCTLTQVHTFLLIRSIFEYHFSCLVMPAKIVVNRHGQGQHKNSRWTFYVTNQSETSTTIMRVYCISFFKSGVCLVVRTCS